MKTNIKMRVTPEQSMKVQEICFENKFAWRDSGYEIVPTEYIFIDSKDIRLTRCNKFFYKHSFCEIDADLFIRTNGTCEEKVLSEDCLSVSEYNLDMLQKKVSNQREELHNLNLKLQKCISLEEHHQITHELKKDLLKNYEKLEYTEEQNKRLNESIKNINDSFTRIMNTKKEQNKEIEKLKAVIEYLESKAK